MKKDIGAIVVCLMLAFCLTACKGKPQKAKVETIDGVTYIHNPAPPLHTSRGVIFEEEFTYKDTGESGEIRLFKPGRFAVDAEGKIYVKDESDMAIKVFNQAGKFLHAIGRRGEGPGEFTYIGDIVPLPDGRLLVIDFGARRTSFFSSEGSFLSSFQWTINIERIYLVTNSSYTLEEGIYGEDKPERWIKTISFSGEELLTFGKFSFPETKTIRIGGGVARMAIPWSPASVFAGDQTRQWLYHCLSDKYEIEVYDQQGKLVRKIDRPYERVPVTSEDISEFRSRFADKPDSPAAKFYQQIEFPKVKSITNRMIVDSEGNLWMRTNEVKRVEGKEIAAYDIFNPDGFYDARIWLDVIPTVFAGGKMYMMDEDETTGMRQVKRYRVIWKES
jgi:hypothetical protein